MKPVVLIKLLLFCSTSFGQMKNDSLTTAFVREYIKPTKSTDTITYARNLKKFSIDYLKEKFNKKSNLLFSYDGDTLVLTQKEKRYIRNELENLKTFNWNKNLFNVGKAIEGDKVWSALENGTVNEVDVFSRPIFIRNNSIFLFYHIHFKGLGGPDYFGFFKQSGGQWKPWITIFSGILN